jgi:hypothetical protein
MGAKVEGRMGSKVEGSIKNRIESTIEKKIRKSRQIEKMKELINYTMLNKIFILTIMLLF